jgi:hypothetical protein
MKTKAGSPNSDLGLRDRGPQVTAEPIIEGKKTRRWRRAP